MKHMTWVCISIFFLAIIGFVGAQQTAQVFRVGYLSVQPDTEPGADAFRQKLGELGYLEGNNIEIEFVEAPAVHSLARRNESAQDKRSVDRHR